MKVRYCESELNTTNSTGAGLQPHYSSTIHCKSLFKALLKQSLLLSHFVHTVCFFFCSSSHSCMYTLQGKAVAPINYWLFDSRWCLEHEDLFQKHVIQKIPFLYFYLQRIMEFCYHACWCQCCLHLKSTGVFNEEKSVTKHIICVSIYIY